MPNQAIETAAGTPHTPGAAERSSSEELGSQEAEARDSGIVEVEGKASAVASGVTSALANTLTSVTSDAIKAPVEQGRHNGARTESQDIEIDTDLGSHSLQGPPRPQMITQTVPTGGAVSVAALDEDEILVSDEEIESAEPARPTLSSGLPAFGRSLPPAPPSRTSLPPPRRSSRASALLSSSLPPPSFPSHAPISRAPRAPGADHDPWILANKTLELSRAHARISVLEDQIAFRDARILSLEERLEASQQKVEELQRKLDAQPSPAGAAASRVDAPVANGARAAARPAVTAAGVTSAAAPASAARPVNKHAISIPKPADVARSTETNKPAESTSSPVAAPALGGAQAADDGAEVDGGSIPPDADEDLAAVAAPSGPEDVRRIAGIGPRFEAALRKQGVTRVSQIAAWSDADVRQMAKALKIPKSRIVKGRWVEAARTLLAQEVIGSRPTSE
jgi:NADH-quinone oxidoreductase subunit E